MSVLDSYINILYRALKPRESKRLQAAGQWSKGALGGVPSFMSPRSKPLNFGPIAIILPLFRFTAAVPAAIEAEKK
jgi:hypothetical protein